jgi:hypothetical protein
MTCIVSPDKPYFTLSRVKLTHYPASGFLDFGARAMVAIMPVSPED